MFDISVLLEKFNFIEYIDGKIILKQNLPEVLEYLKNNPEFDFNMLTSIVAIDWNDTIELIYQLYSVSNNETIQIYYYTTTSIVPSVINIFKSAYFDECEIYDMFGVYFEHNQNLKRLFMPKSWIGHPLLKSYKQSDERLAWND